MHSHRMCMGIGDQRLDLDSGLDAGLSLGLYCMGDCRRDIGQLEWGDGAEFDSEAVIVAGCPCRFANASWYVRGSDSLA